MKRLIVFLAFFAVLAVHAQEMDTTFVVNEQGETIGLIHEKGTIPVIPASSAPKATAQQTSAYGLQNTGSSAAVPFTGDSTAIYQNLIETNTEKGNSQRSSGKAMMLGGGLTFGVGTAVMIAGLANISYGEDVDNDGAVIAYFSGILAMTAGEIVFTIGLIKKIVGGSKLRRAERYRQSLELYNAKHQQSLNVQVVPVIDPVNGTYGGNLAFSF